MTPEGAVLQACLKMMNERGKPYTIGFLSGMVEAIIPVAKKAREEAENDRS